MQTHLQSCGDNQARFAHRHSVRSCTNNSLSNFSGLGNLALYHGGGNWGNLWERHQAYRWHMFEVLLNRGMTVVSMPQSLHFTSADAAAEDRLILERLLNRTIGLHNASDRIILTWREQDSLNKAALLYPYVQHRLCPDIAFAIGPLLEVRLSMVHSSKRSKLLSSRTVRPADVAQVDILLLLRDDRESVILSNRNETRIRYTLNSFGDRAKNVSFRVVDWKSVAKMVHPGFWRPFDVSKKDYISLDTDRVLKGCLSMLSTGTVLVTDRLHATILAMLANKPVVYIDPLTRKISKTLAVALNSSVYCSHNYNLGQAYNMTQALEMALTMISNTQ